MADTPKEVFLKDYKVPTFLAPEMHLTFDLFEEESFVTNITSFERNPKSDDLSSEVFLNGEQLDLISIEMNDMTLAPTEYEHTGKGLLLKNCPDRFKLKTKVRLLPQNNKAFSGLYKTNTVFCTQMEAQGFRRTTFCQDRPDVLSRYTTVIRANKEKFPVLLSNGNLVEQKDTTDGQHQATWQDPFPKPCYLFALVAGDLDWIEDSYLTRTKRRVELKIYVDKGKTERARFAMDSLKQSMNWDEETYRLEYDLDIYNIVAVDDFNMGAMENKGLNIFNSKYVLASSKTATDDEYQAIQRVIGHEYFHNWSGNRVTCRDWFQLSLKEGLTVYRDQEFSCDMNVRAVKRIEDVALLRSRQFPEDAGPMAHPVRPPSYIAIDNFYTVTVYEKGAEVIRMLQHLLGIDIFKRGMAKYFEMFDGQAVTTDDWILAMEKVSGRDLSQFKRWYDQAGTPHVHVTSEYNKEAQTLTLTLEQQCIDPVSKKANQPYLMPLKVGFVSSKGGSIEFSYKGVENLREVTLELSEPKQSFVFENVYKTPILSINREFTSPIHLNLEQSQEHLYQLMTSDADSFNRWESAQKIYRKFIMSAYEAEKSGNHFELPDDLVQSMSLLIKNSAEDPALTARLLDLPSPLYVGQFLTEIDPQALGRSYRAIRSQLSAALHNALLETFQSLADKKLGHSPQDISSRSLKNQLMSYLWRHDETQGAQLFYQHYQDAQNMTDKVASLNRLAVSAGPEFQQAMDDFLNQWKNDRLVMNKWFAITANSQSSKVDSLVKTARQNPLYDSANPNNAFALLYNFAQNNWQGFHKSSGENYTWFADQIIDVDQRNPQVSARLGSCFNNWKKLAPSYQEKIKPELQRILDAKPSENLYEIIHRALNNV